MRRNREVVGKLGNMRKDVEWTVYPYKAGERVTIQSDKRIAQVDLTTGQVALANKGGDSRAWINGYTLVAMAPEMLEAIKVITSGDDGTGIICCSV